MISDNLRYLRKKNGLSQQNVADQMAIPRTTYSEYEKGNTEPGIKLLIRLSDFFECTIDNLVNSQLAHEALEIGQKGDYKILATTIDSEGRHNIELVETKAEAGYIRNNSDPEYISDLPKMFFPVLRDGLFRAFEIHGDSMLPLESGSIVVSKFIERPEQIKDGKTYVVITHKDGVVYKRLTYLSAEHAILAQSDNLKYKPFIIDLADIQEIWQYHAHIGFNDLKSTYDSLIEDRLNEILKKVNMIQESVNA